VLNKEVLKSFFLRHQRELPQLLQHTLTKKELLVPQL
jgi:hypothetical protein